MNSLSQLLAALDAVQGHFSAVVPSQQAAEQAEAAACLLYESVQGASPRDIADAWEFIQEEALAAAAHSLSQLAAAAAPALAQLDSPPLWLSQQIDVGCSVLDSLNRLADQAPQLSAQTARQMEAACALVLGPGRALLQALTAVVQSGGEGTAEWLHGACDRQLLLWIKMVDSVWRCQPAAPAFANSIRQPAFLPWLAAVSAALPAAFPGGQPDQTARLATTYLTLLLNMLELDEDMFAGHAAATAADPAVQQAIIGALLGYCLPATTAAVRAEMQHAGLHADGPGTKLLQMLPRILQCDALVAAVEQYWCPAEGAVAALAVERAAALVSTIAAARPASLPDEVFAADLTNAAGVLSRCCHGVAEAAEAASAGSPAEMRAATWHIAALLPQLAAALSSLTGSVEAQGGTAEGALELQRLDALCFNLHNILFVMNGLSLEGGSPQQMCTWLAAVTAGLRLLPCLSRALEAAAQQQVSLSKVATIRGGLVDICINRPPRRLLQLLTVLGQKQKHGHGSSTAALPPEEAAAWDNLPDQLWTLHTTVCRLVAALAAPEAPLRLTGQQMQPDLWRLLLCLHNTLLIATVNSHRHTQRAHGTNQADWKLQAFPEVPRDVLAQLQAVCVGHVAAVLVAVAPASESFAEASRSDDLDESMQATALPLVASALPEAFVPGLLIPLDALMKRPRQDMKGHLQRAMNLKVLLECPSAYMAVALASSSLPKAALELAEQLECSGDAKAARKAAALMQSALRHLATVASAASTAAAQGSSSGASDGLVAQLNEAAQQLGERPPDSLSDAHGTAQLLQHAAGLMQRHYAQPAVEADTQLVLAQAAAGRSCAYLRCANLGGEGGPAAGQGVGSMQCSACRAVWYCGTACSHADWRNGWHRHVCRALGAARRAAKEAAPSGAER